MILIDTNVISAIMAPMPPSAVLAWLDQQHSDSLYLSSVTVAEIASGIMILPGGKRRETLKSRFEDFVIRGFAQRVLVFDIEAAIEYGKVMARRRDLGRPLSVPGGQIAAIARHHGIMVATRNLRDFEDCGLDLVDPFAV